MEELYCRCCLSTGNPLYRMVKDSLLIVLYRLLLGYQERHEDLSYIVCGTCKHLLHRMLAFQDACRKADLLINKYKAQHLNIENDNQAFLYASLKISSILPQLKYSGTQNVDIPAEDCMLIRRRPVNVVTLSRPENIISKNDKDSNQIILSFKNPIDVVDDEENECDTEDLMFKSTDLSVVDDDSYFDFTIVVKNNVEEDCCHKCYKRGETNEIQIKTKSSTETKDIGVVDDDIHNKTDNIDFSSKNDSEQTNDIQKSKLINHHSKTNANRSNNILYETKNGVIGLRLNADVDVQNQCNEMTNNKDVENSDGVDSVLGNQCSDGESSFDVKEEVNDFDIEDELDLIATEDASLTNDGQILLKLAKAEDQTLDDLQKISAVFAHVKKTKKIKTRKLKLKKKNKLNIKVKSKRRYPCEICGLVFDLAIHLEIHNSTHTGLSRFVCDVCCRAFPLKSALEKHMACHSCDRKRYKCDMCPKTFIFKKLLYKHKFKHTNEIKPYVCNICSRGFVFENELMKHMLLHTDIRPFSCPKCPKKFTQKAFLSQHLLTHVEGELYICDICGKGFGQNAKLSYHRKTHLEIKPFQCDLCPRSFVRSGQLKTHKIYHSDERPWVCEHCGRSFRVKGALTAHRRVHSGARPYKCDICHQSYTEAGYLKKHKRIHSGIKPFSCDICGRSFNETCTLARHKLTHSDERKHVCKECGGKFKYSGCLNKHIQRKHGNTRLQMQQ